MIPVSPVLTIRRNRFRRFLAILPLAGALFAAEPPKVPDYVLTVTADRPDAIYQQGDNVAFTMKLMHRGEPVEDAEVKWTLSKDGVPPRRQGQAILKDGTFTVGGQLDEPGFLHCLAEYLVPGGERIMGRAGAAIAPLAIKPSSPPPDDFDVFWAAQKAELAAIPPEIRLIPVKSPSPDVECFEITANSVGASLSGYLARPLGAKAKSLPGIVLTHGAGVNSSRLGNAVNWAKSGLVALDFNVHGLPNGQPPEFYTQLRDGELKNYNVRGRESRETVYFRHVFLRLLRAIDAVAAQPEWDGQRMVICGRSQGGAQAIVAGGLDPRVTYVSAEVPALCDHTGILIGRVNGWPRFIPNETAQPDPGVVQAVRYYDAVNFAARIRCESFLTVGFIDVVCPPTGIYAAYNQIPGKKGIWNHIDTGHVGRADYEARMQEEILAYLQAHPLAVQ
jgi:cephalosporin-C deacetylase